MTDDPLFTCVVVTWNSDDHLGDCIEAIRRSEAQSDTSVEILVIDNASTDHTTDIATKTGADRIVRNPINAGFAVAASQGVALARGMWIVMTNPDLVVHESFVKAVTSAVRAAPANVSCFAPEIYFLADSMRINSRGIAVDDVGLPSEIGKGQLVSKAPIPVRVFAGSGGGSILRRTALDKVGAFDPVYFAYYEDVDLAWRLQRSGYRTLFLPNARASHAGSSTVGVASPLQTYLVARNRRLIFYRHGPHSWRARMWRTLTDIIHASVLCVATRSAAPLYGRASAIRLRLYLRFLRRTDAANLTGDHDTLVARIPFKAALRRKVRSIALEKHS